MVRRANRLTAGLFSVSMDADFLNILMKSGFMNQNAAIVESSSQRSFMFSPLSVCFEGFSDFIIF